MDVKVVNSFDKSKHATQPVYCQNDKKFKAREQIVSAYRQLTGTHSIPDNKNYWTLCNKQPDTEGSEINQLVDCGLIKKNQFYGVDYDLQNEGIIEFNKQEHPEANWYKGDWLKTIDENYELFNPAIVYFDCTRTVSTASSYVAKTLDLCPERTMVVINLMLTTGHSSKQYDPGEWVKNLKKRLRLPNEWTLLDKYYQYKSSKTEMATYIFIRN